MSGGTILDQLGKAQEWMRKPDQADRFSIADLVRWINDRPLLVLIAAQARITADAEKIRDLETSLRAFGASQVRDRVAARVRGQCGHFAGRAARRSARCPHPHTGAHPMSTPTLQLAMAILDMKWMEMTEFSEFIGAIATDDDGKPNDPDYIARILHDWAREAGSQEPTR